MKQKRTCSNCINAVAISVNNDFLCRVKGAVSQDYVCAKHRYAPEPKSYKDMNYKCIHCENFIVNIHGSHDACSLGLCQLFSIRQFDGNLKNACSKFIKRREQEVG